MATVRAFVAIELPAPVKEALREVQDSLKKEGDGQVRWVGMESIHLTLKFLGNVPTEKVEAIAQAVKGACRGVRPFSLELKDTGVFPGVQRPRVVWVGVGGEEGILALLQGRVEANLAALGFPREGRPFTAHLTLGRVREDATPAARRRLGEGVAAAQLPRPTLWRVTEATLMRSQLTPSGAIYTPLAVAPLLEGE
ncbi:MAG: RNA 2',3'-cyclic phosphodiesterase [Chloroflexi bacterium]|nr:RNA 2',3'-cyclic phosphodiesterase [Chloroflexota bacterium]